MSAATTAMLALCLFAAVALMIVVVLYVVPNLNTVFGNVVAFVDEGIFGIQGIAVTVINGVGSVLQGGQAFVLNIGSGLANAVSVVFSAVFSAIKTIVNAVGTALTFVYSSIRDLIQSIQTTATQFYDTFIQPVINAFNSVLAFINVINNDIASLVSAIKNIANFPPNL